MRIEALSLYSAEPSVEATFGDGVFCLAGANGLGKSTFLSALNFALTGVVPEPSRVFQSVEEYYRHNLAFAKDYFDGRIDESDRDAAEVCVEMRVGPFLYTVTRGMFEPEELRGLKIEVEDENGPTTVVDLSEETPRERQRAYAARLSADIGLQSFPQFVFLQGFLFTFDERRHLLFWDEKVLDQVLYLAFGVDVAEAQRADVLRRESEKADSLARNYNWQATDLRKKIEDLNSAFTVPPPDTDETELVSKHKDLVEREESSYHDLQTAQDVYNEAVLRLAELGAQYATLRSEYEAEFAQRMNSYTDAGHQPLVALSIARQRCEVCSTIGLQVAQTIESKLHEHTCPLCDSKLEQRDSALNMLKLQELDKQLSQNKAAIGEASLRRERVREELASLEAMHHAAKAALTSFEKANTESLRKLTAYASPEAGNAATLAIQRYRDQISELLIKKENQYAIRNERRKSLLSLQRRLIKQYQEAEEEFVPSFRNLAVSFLGLDLDISLQPKTPVGLSMLLEVKSMTRRHTHQLSESQRFFVDIALRMALIHFMSGGSHRGALLVDTPEGSLDIAYETRAGDMFAGFVKLGYSLIMTANINSSRLLLSLAEKCGRQQMTLCRMTSWTDLSDVQISEEKLFDEAYADIEKALDRHQPSVVGGLAS